ncbi:hypothetical protein ACHAW6_000422 [Cyclotella cf. meneghiniana]
MQLRTPACQTHILPVLSSNSLLSIRTFADNGYVTIFHEGNRGATVHDHNDVTITSIKPANLQGCRDKNDSGAYPLQNLPAYYTILLGTASTISTASHLPHI